MPTQWLYKLYIQNQLNILETRRFRGDQIELFKILNGYENIYRNISFSVKDGRKTRGHGIILAKKQCTLDIKNSK